MDYSISLVIRKNIKCQGRRIGDYLYDKNTDTIYYELPYPFPCKLAVKGLQEIIATPMMTKLPTFLTFHNIDFLRQQLYQIKCIKNECVLLHGAAWLKNGKGYLAVGFSNSGKTSRVLREVKKGATFCADENVIVSKEMWIAPISRKTSLSWGLAKEMDYKLTLRQKIAFFNAWLRAKIFPIFEPNIWMDLAYPKFYFTLDKLIFLNEGKGESLLLLTDNEFPFYTNPLIQTYAYATGFDLEGIYEKYKILIANIGKCSD